MTPASKAAPWIGAIIGRDGWQERAAELAGLLEAALPHVGDEALYDRIVMLLTGPNPCGEVDLPGASR